MSDLKPPQKDAYSLILEAIDMDSYRAEKQAAMKIALADEDTEIEPVPTDTGSRKPEPELDPQSEPCPGARAAALPLLLDAEQTHRQPAISMLARTPSQP